MTLDEAYRACEAIAREHREAYPFSPRLLPTGLRRPVAALTAFARTADDFADEPRWDGRRAEQLDRWEDQLVRCYHGEATHPVFVALADTVERFDIPITPFLDLLAGFRTDAAVTRFATFQDLLGYTGLVGRPVGQLLLYVLGYRDPEVHRFGEELSTAVALTRFWQTFGQDAPRGRVRLPDEDLRHFGVTDDQLRRRRRSPALAALLRAECSRTRAYFHRAAPLVQRVRASHALELALIWQRGLRTLDHVEARAADPFGRPARLGPLDHAAALAGAARAVLDRRPAPRE